MDPFTTAILATSAISAAAQAYNAYKARGASKEQLDRIEDLYQDIIPPNYDLEIDAPPELHNERLAEPVFQEALKRPEFDLTKLDPEKIKLLSQFNPEIPKFIAEADPTLFERTPEMQQYLEPQKKALERFMQIGEGDYDHEYQQRVQEARQRAQAEAQSRSESILQDYERRGLGGSGLELAAQIGAGAEAMDRNAMMGLQAETDAYRNQLNALAQGANIGQQMYGQEASEQMRNQDIINAFNQRMSQRQQNWENARAQALSQADLRNIQEAQRIAEFNAQQQYQADLQNRQRTDDIARYMFDVDRYNQSRDDAQQQYLYGIKGDERAYQNQLLMDRYNAENARKQYLNNLKSQSYNDRLRKASGLSGASQMKALHALGAGQDRAAAIQGLSNAGMIWSLGQRGKKWDNQPTYNKLDGSDYNYQAPKYDFESNYKRPTLRKPEDSYFDGRGYEYA